MATRKSQAVVAAIALSAVVAAIALSAVAATGSTLALWDDDTSALPEADITSGHFDIEAGTQTVADVSPDDGEPDELIALADFRAVPGDVIRIAQPITIDLEGDNIAAKATVDTESGASLSGPLADIDEGVYVSAVGVYAGEISAEAADLGENLADEHGVVYFDTGHDDGDEPVTANYTLVYEVTFSVDSPDQVRQDVTATLAGSAVTLEQVRADALP